MKLDKSCYNVGSKFHKEHVCSRQRRLYEVLMGMSRAAGPSCPPVKNFHVQRP